MRTSIISTACCLLWVGTATAQFSISLGVKPGQLKFEYDELAVPANSEVTLTFLNNGIMPHNFVLCDAKREEAVVEAAAKMKPATAPALGWVPESEYILAHTKLVQGGTKEVITFRSPEVPGRYVYLCSFPGHWFLMRGTLVVGGRPEPISSQMKLEAPSDSLTLSTVHPKPEGSLTRPFIIHTFMPDPGLPEAVFQFHHQGFPASKYSPNSGRDVSGTVNPIHGLPAAIGVNHGPTLSYCWDTVECKLLYAWVGGFLDMTPYWGGGTGGGRRGFGYVPPVIGRVFHLTSTRGPLATEDVTYHGFRLENGVPVFRYERGGFGIEERIEPAGGAMLQTFRLKSPEAASAVFAFTGEERAMLRASTGEWNGTRLTVPVDGSALLVLTWKVPAAPSPPPPPEPVAVDSTDGVLESIFRKNGEKQPSLVKGGLKAGGRIYADRDYTYTKVPERLRGADIVQTFNDDKKAGKGSYEFTLAKPGRVVVLYDSRLNGVPPLNGKQVLRQTKETVETSTDFRFLVLEAELGRGSYHFPKQNGASHLTFTAFAVQEINE